MTKILIIRFSSIGDIVLTSPVVRCIKEQVDDCEIHFITKEAFAPILESSPYLYKVHRFKDDLSTNIKELKTVGFDYVIDLHNNIRSRRVTTALDVKASRFHKLNTEKWLLVNLKVNQLPNIHIVDRYVDTTKDLGVTNDNKGLDFFIPTTEEVGLSTLPSYLQNGFVSLVIGARHNTKKLPEHKLKDLLNLLQYPTVIIGGPEDAEMGERLAADYPEKVWNACGKFNLYGSASLIKQSNVVVTHDTGMMHIAAAFNKPTVSIWGNTVTDFGMYPYMPTHPERSKIIEVNNLSCRPCSKIGYEKCPKGHFRCMEEIDIIEVVAETEAFWNSGLAISLA